MPEKIKIEDTHLIVPNYPIIPIIQGDGIGSDITPAMKNVVNQAVNRAYNDSRAIQWKPVLAGEQAFQETGEYLPEKTLEILREHIISIKWGPLSTPIGGGIRSLNVTIRQILDLYSCIRPIKWYGSASPLRHPEKMDIVVFRENTEDVYAGVEYESMSTDAKRILSLLRDMGVSEEQITSDSAIGIKPISPTRTNRHVLKALKYAIEKKRKRITIMHKGNIMKFTEGAFMRWSYEQIKTNEFNHSFIMESELWDDFDGKIPEGKILVNDRIADNMFQQILTRTDEYDMIVSPNLNGDYISDAASAGVGGLGMAPGANIGDFLAVFEATHGTAPKYAGKDKINPSSIILSGAMMLEYMGWEEAATGIHRSLEKTLSDRIGTYDLVRGWKNQGEKRSLTEVSCSEFAAIMIDNLP